jgi:hypothetical protein
MNTRYQIITVLVSTLLLSACGNSNNSNENKTADGPRQGIRQGQTAEAGDSIARHTVAVIGGKFESVCSGTLITRNVVLTAAHCIPKDKGVGLVFSVKITDGRAYRPASVTVVHADYIDRLSHPDPADPTKKIMEKNRNDIALIYFKGDLPSGYEPAPILDDTSLATAGTTTTVAGYGVYNDGSNIVAPGVIASNLAGSGTGLLRSANVTVLDDEFSETETVLDQTSGMGACKGDSGGPAYVQVGHTFHVWGVASWGVSKVPKGSCLEYAIYTKVEPYKPWIAKALEIFERY